MLTAKIITLLLILFVTLGAGFYPFFVHFKAKAKEVDFPIGEAVASGVFLGAGLLHMFPRAMDGFSRLGIHYPVAFLLAGGLFLILLLLEQECRFVYKHKGQNSKQFAILALCFLSFHSLLVGMALGLSHSYAILVLLLLAVLLHKWAASFALAIRLAKSGFHHYIMWLLFLVFALMVPTGILLGMGVVRFLHQEALVLPIVTSLAAGTFMYFGTLHGLEEGVMVKRYSGMMRYVFVMVGFAIMAVAAIWT